MIRWVLRVVVGLIVLVIGAVVLLFVLPADRIAKVVTDQFEAATGRAMTLQGDVRPTLWPELGVNTGPVTIANADWSPSGPMLTAQSLSIGVDIGALIGGTIHVKRIEAEAPKIILEVARDGRANWDLGGGSADDASPNDSGVNDSGANESTGLPQISLDRATMTGASVTFVDYASGGRTELNQIEASLSLPSVQGTANLALSAVMQGQPFSVDATINGFADFLSKGVVPVSADAKIGGSAIAFKGRGGLVPFALGGALDADLADMAAVFRLVGQAAPDLPLGFGQKVAVTGNITVTDTGGVTLRDGVIRLDQNVLTGAVDLNTSGDRPSITAKLSAGALDFSNAIGGEASAAPGDTTGASGWSRDRIDVSALGTVDADIALAAASIDIGLAQFGRTSIISKLDAGRAVTEIKELVAYGGQIGGSFVINSRGGLSARATLAGDGVALEPLLNQLAGYDRLLANGTVTINVLGVGNDMFTLMNSLNGDGTLKLGKGELKGLDLVGMLRNLDPSFIGAGASTIFNSITGTFKVVDGVMSNVDLQLLSPLLNATGSGEIGIGGQTLDYRVVAKLLEGQTNGGISVPVIISGSWTKPKFRLDLEAIAKQQFGDEIEEVKTRAESEVVKKINEELGTNVESLDNIEDTLKKELEQRATKGLLDLLGGN